MNNHWRQFMHVYASFGISLIICAFLNDHSGFGVWLFISSILYAAIGAMRGTQKT